MNTSRPLPNFFALYLLPWALMSWSVARLLGVRQYKSGSETGPAPEAEANVRPNDKVMTADEEVRLLHILE